jgi:hypothetical protein
LLDSAEWECELSAASGDGLVVGVAEKVLRTLEDRLPDLRSRVLIEAAQPMLEHARALCEQLREPLMNLCSLGKVDTTDQVRSRLDVRVTMPIGSAVELSAYPDDEMTGVWRKTMAALEADPMAPIGPKFNTRVRRK